MFYLPMVKSSEEPLEKVGEEEEVYKAVCKRVCPRSQAVVSMMRLVEAVMLLEGIGVRSESQMDQQLAVTSTPTSRRYGVLRLRRHGRVYQVCA